MVNKYGGTYQNLFDLLNISEKSNMNLIRNRNPKKNFLNSLNPDFMRNLLRFCKTNEI